ncbi:hypothetical protein MVEN_01281400 [Mycena venus]|uniref:Uncharacterized protein n=1 Tax=Mycena venus TaxID=2733690 RepID=A0A8H7CVL0_9AGAR|nr:hypothetical protein MVEN_01281400 [Mycena venus]
MAGNAQRRNGPRHKKKEADGCALSLPTPTTTNILRAFPSSRLRPLPARDTPPQRKPSSNGDTPPSPPSHTLRGPTASTATVCEWSLTTLTTSCPVASPRTRRLLTHTAGVLVWDTSVPGGAEAFDLRISRSYASASRMGGGADVDAGLTSRDAAQLDAFRSHTSRLRSKQVSLAYTVAQMRKFTSSRYAARRVVQRASVFTTHACVSIARFVVLAFLRSI